MASDNRKSLACAVYTRKSSEEGLEQEFNSLDAQREACEAYILSQKHEGWKVVPSHYDDGGFSGGNMDRPALVQLMDDVRAKKIDVIVVYKVDRLTRSLSDFAKIVEIFDEHGVSFVSVTQQFNTTTSMGRLTLNVLLSFAQFEREVTGERIRDKIAASKKKGMFVGGGIPIGYDLEDHKLVINKEDARTVNTLFELYIELGTVRQVAAEAIRLGLRTKVRVSQKTNRTHGGVPFKSNHLYWILKNRTYLGEIQHKGQIYVGQHEPIVDRALFDRVQEILANHARDRVNGTYARNPSPLAGILFDDRGNRMSPTHTQKEGYALRYYICRALVNGQPEKVGVLKRVPAKEIEGLIAQQCYRLLHKPAHLIEQIVGEDATSETKQSIATAAARLSGHLLSFGEKRQLEFARATISKIVAGPESVQMTFNLDALKIELGLAEIVKGPNLSGRISPPKLEGGFAVTVPIHLTRSGRNKCMVIADDKGERRLMNDSMVLAIARAVKWDGELRAGASLIKFAKREDLSKGYVTRIMPLAFLAPDIVQAIYDGRQPLGLKVKQLSANLPLDWVEQRRVLGFPAR